MSKINDTTCAIHNISREGMLVTAELKTPPFRVTIELRIRNRWVILKGNVMWCSNGRNSLTKKMGIFIIEAPAEFHDFIDNLYLEADEQTH